MVYLCTYNSFLFRVYIVLINLSIVQKLRLYEMYNKRQSWLNV